MTDMIDFMNATNITGQTLNESHHLKDNKLSNESYSLSDTEILIVNVIFDRILKLLVTVTGVIGNGLIILILTKRKNRYSSTAVYLTALAISDILVLLFGPFSQWLITVWNIDITGYITFECKLYAFMQSTSVSISSWLLVAVTFERVICVISPYHVKVYCTKKLAVTFIFVIWLIMYMADIHFLINIGHRYNKHCMLITEDDQTNINYFLPWIDFFTAFGLPVLLLTIGNIIIIRKVTKNRVLRNRMTFGQGVDSSAITPILISATTVFIITLAPYYIVSVCLPHWISQRDRQFVYYIDHFWNPILRVIWESNAALNFVLYFLSGSKFRFEVKAMFSCSCAKYSHRAGVFDLSFTAEMMNRVP